jgi:guanidinopropionase
VREDDAVPRPIGVDRISSDPRDPRTDSLLSTAVPAVPARWRLLGLPYDGGIPSRPGARFGPAAVRRALSAFTIFDGDHALAPIEDLGDLGLPSMNGLQAHQRMESTASRLFIDSRPIAFIGGDHGCTGSVIRGLATARPSCTLALISVDAHLDVREYDSDATLSSGTPFRRALETTILDGARLALIGLRPFANSEFYMAWTRARGVRIVSADEIGARGATAVVDELLASTATGADALYLSVDLDAADVAYAPGVSAPGTGGLTSREMIAIVAAVAQDPRLVGADFMELSPPYDQDDRTARLAARLLLELMRRSRE